MHRQDGHKFCLLSTRNAAFPKLLAQIIKLRAHHSDYPIKSIRLDNAAEFTSKTFDDYCMTLGIEVEHPVAYVHTQNGLAEAFIKRLQMIARTLVMRTKLPVSAWGYAILHAAALVRLRPMATQTLSAYQLVTGYEPDVSHLRVFGCLVNVPIEPPKRSKFGPQKHTGCGDGFKWLYSPDPNPNVAIGALVGGPFQNDSYMDIRNNSMQGEPSTYNSALIVALLSGLVSTSSAAKHL
ncbi:hypothetical protein M0R45_004012 [Rubus argutus]|uniref:cellulase n=1 Tax=Rubus argutus TaxID=59490 RepID=A0AAW1YHT4_RUBAR